VKIRLPVTPSFFSLGFWCPSFCCFWILTLWDDIFLVIFLQREGLKIIYAIYDRYYKNVHHTFSGTPRQKSIIHIVNIDYSAHVDFIPKEIPDNFPQMFVLAVRFCKTLKTVRDDFFSSGFNVLKNLELTYNKIETIEANAFQHLTRLEVIYLTSNEIRSLPHQIFKNNLVLRHIELNINQIHSITPDFFKNLNKLKYVQLSRNQCIKKRFGCASGSIDYSVYAKCFVSHSNMNWDLKPCYNNCLTDVECASKSGKNNIIECNAKKVEEISPDLKALKQDVTSLVQSNVDCTSNYRTIDSELKSLKQELAELKTKFQESKDCNKETANLETRLIEHFKKEFNEFVSKLNN
jgi:hypothetical protein